MVSRGSLPRFKCKLHRLPPVTLRIWFNRAHIEVRHGYGLSCVPWNIRVEALTSNVTLFGNSFLKVIRLNETIRVRSSSDRIGVLIRRARERELSFSLCSRNQERPGEHTARRLFSAGQEERSHQHPTMLASWSQTSCLQNWEKIHFCCLNRLLYGICYGNLSWLIHSPIKEDNDVAS